MVETNPKEFERFYDPLMQTASKDYIPWLFPVKANGKDPDGIEIWKRAKPTCMQCNEKWITETTNNKTKTICPKCKVGKGSWHALHARLTKAEAIARLKQNKNVGISARKGDQLVLYDRDSETVKDKIKTLTSMSGKRIAGHTFAWRDKKDTTLDINISTDTLGEVRSSNQYVVAPGSFVPNKQKNNDSLNGCYTVATATPPIKMKYEQLPDAFLEYAKKEKEQTKRTTTQNKKTFKPDDDSSALFKLTIANVVDATPVGNHQHPLHESDSEKNFRVGEDLAQCWRHHVSLNAFQFLVVKSNYMTCKEAGTGDKTEPSESQVIGDDGALYSAWMQAEKDELLPPNDPMPARAKNYIEKKNLEQTTGTVISDSVDVPTTELVNFSEYIRMLQGTHKHLDAFDLVDSELGLIGEEYYTIKKNICYDVESQRQDTITFHVGTEPFDNRMHNAFMGGAGKGKNKVKTLSKQSNSYGEISANRTHIEQLIGKMKRVGKEYKEELGFFRRKKLLVDESGSLLAEVERNDAAIMQEMRLAMDPYGYNEVEKKLVDTGSIKYYPETRFSYFVHEMRFPPKFFDRGTFRRPFMFEMQPKKISENAGDANLYATKNKNEFKEYIRNPGNQINSLEFPIETINTIVRAKKIWNRFTLQNKNKRVRAIAQRLFFGLNQYFFRCAGILAITRNEKKVSIKTAELASLDCIHFLLETFTVYCNSSQINYSSDIWKTENMEEAAFFEWLYLNGARTQDTTNISISKAQTEICEIFGVNDRQGRSKFSDLKRRGCINSKKGQKTSKTWLAFKPALEGTIEFGQDEVLTLKEYITAQVKKLHGLRVAGVVV